MQKLQGLVTLIQFKSLIFVEVHFDIFIYIFISVYIIFIFSYGLFLSRFISSDFMHFIVIFMIQAVELSWLFNFNFSFHITLFKFLDSLSFLSSQSSAVLVGVIVRTELGPSESESFGLIISF